MSVEAAAMRHRYVALDSMRGICACMVVMLHFISQGYVANLLIVRHAYLFVDFFFVLSGFVIGASYGARLGEGFSLALFMQLRLGRIYPLHVFILALYLAFEIALALLAPRRPAFTSTFSPEGLLHSLLLVQIFFGSLTFVWNWPSWSIAAEFWTYLIFALLLRHLGRWIVPVSLLIACAGAAVLAVSSDRYINVVHDGALARCLFGFALGIVAWRMIDRVEAIALPPWGDLAVEALAVAAVILFVSLGGAGPVSLAAPPLFLAVLLIFARERGPVSALLRTGPFLLLGTLSYSIYMTHALLHARFVNMLEFAEKLTGVTLVGEDLMIVGNPLFCDAMMLLFLALVIGCAYITYYLVERPGRAFARRGYRPPVRLLSTAP